MAILRKAYRKDEPIRLSDLDFPDTDLFRMRQAQAALG
jgi:hypothetical protein